MAHGLAVAQTVVAGQAVFGAATVALVGVYAAAVAAPRAWLTRWLVAGPAVYLALAGAMVGFACVAKEPLLWALPRALPSALQRASLGAKRSA